MKKAKYRPRNDMILIRRVDRGSVRGIVMPNIAQEGKVLIVEEVGPDVKDGLKTGDVVLAIGTPGQDLVRIPESSDLFLTRQGNVLVVVEEGDE
jgi:hypothetical protein